MKKLSILGSTGSIGTQTSDIVKNNPNKFEIIGLTTNKNIELLKKQIDEFKPEAVAVMDKEKADELKIVSQIITDAGLTEIPAGTKTVLGIGPAPSNLIDQITGDLQLL